MQGAILEDLIFSWICGTFPRIRMTGLEKKAWAWFAEIMYPVYREVFYIIPNILTRLLSILMI